MPVQSTIARYQPYGVPGGLCDTSPRRVQPFLLNSADAANNVIGRAFSKISEGVAAVGNTTGALVFAGYFINLKEYALRGTSQDVLAASLAVPNNTEVSLLTMGCFWTMLPAAAAIGDWVVIDNVTGAPSTVTPGSALPTGKSDGFAVVDRFTPTTEGLAAIMVSPHPKVFATAP